MKIIFLDFDNVLNHVNWRNTHLPFDPACTERLNRLTRATRAEIVVSSSWRNNRRYATDAERLAHLRGMLEGGGVAGEVIDYTPIIEPRSKAIREWMKSRPVTAYVILDDDVTACIDPTTFVKTSVLSGLTDDDVKRAVAILSV